LADLRGVDEPIELFHLVVAEDDGDTITDPVCGLRIPRAAALSVPVQAEGGEDDVVWFCSEACAASYEG
jgi:YHS domain-containing protein